MSERRRLPNRRGAEIRDFVHAGSLWTLTIGRLEDGSVGELFVSGSKETPLLELVQESRHCCEPRFQSGCPLEILRHALGGRNAGPLGVALALIDEARRDE